MLLKDIKGFRLNIRAAVRSLWNGNIDFVAFFSQMQVAIRRGFTQAWAEGAAIYGIKPDEYTDAERNRLQQEIVQESQFIMRFADAIEAHSKKNGGKLEPLFTRAELWIAAYDRILNLAIAYAGKDQKLKWVIGPTKEHCRDCSGYNGRVYRASIWAKYDIYPRKWNLACKGVHCLCEFEQTDERVTSGFPPGIKG